MNLRSPSLERRWPPPPATSTRFTRSKAFGDLSPTVRAGRVGQGRRHDHQRIAFASAELRAARPRDRDSGERRCGHVCRDPRQRDQPVASARAFDAGSRRSATPPRWRRDAHRASPAARRRRTTRGDVSPARRHRGAEPWCRTPGERRVRPRASTRRRRRALLRGRRRPPLRRRYRLRARTERDGRGGGSFLSQRRTQSPTAQYGMPPSAFMTTAAATARLSGGARAQAQALAAAAAQDPREGGQLWWRAAPGRWRCLQLEDVLAAPGLLRLERDGGGLAVMGGLDGGGARCWRRRPVLTRRGRRRGGGRY